MMIGKPFSRAVGAVSAAVIAFSAIPFGSAESAEEEFLVRDPFYGFSSDYSYYETEHFQFIWGKSGEASKVTEAFLKGNGRNLEECWDIYMSDLGMAAPSQSTNVSLRDGKNYKTNIYISGTGLSGMEDDWAYMSYDKDGFAYMFCCPDSMQYDPPSWVLPHEFGHVVTAHQLGWNDNKYSYAWWEAMGNWFREQYFYNSDMNGSTDFFETYLKNMQFTFPLGRDFYAAWPFLQYLTENPDELEGYGESFVKTMLQDGQKDEFPFDMVDRLAPADFKDTLGSFAKHMAALDFEHGELYRERLSEIIEERPWSWQQIYTIPERIGGDDYAYKVPTERAPQAGGINIIPLEVVEKEVSMFFRGAANIEGADWRACLVQQLDDGSCIYSDLVSDREEVTVTISDRCEKLYMTVAATPDQGTYTKTGLPYGEGSEFAEENYPFTEKERYPYNFDLGGAYPVSDREIPTGDLSSYKKHPNGGGLVSELAHVDDSVYVAADAMVMAGATVKGNVRIEDHAIVGGYGVVLEENAVAAGYAYVGGTAHLSGNARVDDFGVVFDNAQITDNAKVTESACVFGNAKMSGSSWAKGCAYVMADAELSGHGVVDGDYYDDAGKKVSKGTAYGWVSSQKYVDSLADQGNLMYDYEFSEPIGEAFASASDKYNSTFIQVIQSLWNEQKTGANGVLTMNGLISFAELDRGILYTEDIEVQTAFLMATTKLIEQRDDAALLFLGNDHDYIKVLAPNSKGYIEAEFKCGDKVERLTADRQYELGEWLKFRLIVEGDEGRMIVNDETVAEGTITIDPCDIADAVNASDVSAAYRLGSINTIGKSNFCGRLDYLRIFSGEGTAPTEEYTERESFNNTNNVLIGDLDNDGAVTSLDLVLMKRYKFGELTLSPKKAFICDVNSDGYFDSKDLKVMNSYLLGREGGFTPENAEFDAEKNNVTVFWE